MDLIVPPFLFLFFLRSAWIGVHESSGIYWLLLARSIGFRSIGSLVCGVSGA